VALGDGWTSLLPDRGVAIIRTSTQFPPPFSVNARCLEGVDVGALTIRRFDGKALIA
jgi:hypothetical protein